MTEITRLTARWVFPLGGAPVEGGVVEVRESGGGNSVEIVSTGARPADRRIRDLGNVAIIPGLVNAHAHLEFADLAAPLIPGRPFTDWIRRLMAHRRERRAPLDELVRTGLAEAVASGTAAVGDIVTGDWTPGSVSPAGPAAGREISAVIVAFRELIGLRAEQVAPQLEFARRHLSDCRAARDVGLTTLWPALSPHAPYSVRPELFHALVDLAADEHVPLCLHLAETPAELELLESGTGEFADLLRGLNLFEPALFPPGVRPRDWLEPLARLDHALIAHGNYLADDEIAWLGAHPQVAVVYCPRTHAFFGQAPHPWRKLLDAGATVCLGTDGRSSNPDYSLWEEVRFLDRQTRGTWRPQLLELATRGGTRALGLEEPVGSAHANEPPHAGLGSTGLTVIRLPDEPWSDPWQLLFHGRPEPLPLNSPL